MKKFLKIIAAVIFIGSVTAFVRIGGKEKSVLDVKAELEWIQTKDSVYYLSAKVSLINNSPDTIYYESMSCSWRDRYTINTDTMSIFGSFCKKNGPRNVAILPYGTDARGITLDNAKRNFVGLKFKMGFHFIRLKDEKGNPYGSLYKDTLIWSNEVEITKDIPVKYDAKFNPWW